MRKFILAVVLFLGILFIFAQFAELKTIVETLQRGNFLFLALAVIVEAAWIVNFAASFRAIYRSLGITESIERLIFIGAAANFVNVIAPSGGVGGIAVFVAEARRRRYSPARAALAGALFVLFDYLGFFTVLGLGLIVLLRRNNLTTVEITAAIIMVSIAIVLGILLYLGMQSGEALGRALKWIVRVVNKLLNPLIHRQYLSEERAAHFAIDAASSLVELRANPKQMLLPFGLALTNKSFLVSILLLSFMAFKVPVSIGTVIAGFSIAYLFTVVSPTPAGLGVVEGVMTLSLTSMFVSIEAAAVITLAYRAVTFWIPLLFGMFSFRHLDRLAGIKQPISSVE